MQFARIIFDFLFSVIYHLSSFRFLPLFLILFTREFQFLKIIDSYDFKIGTLREILFKEIIIFNFKSILYQRYLYIGPLYRMQPNIKWMLSFQDNRMNIHCIYIYNYI